jgi:hypothetical protein
MRPTVSLLALFILGAPLASYAQHDDRRHGRHDEKPPATATVEFGILQLAPIGPAPCAQLAAPQPAGVPTIGGPLDPCAFRIHALFPDQVTVAKGGEVSFNIHGGGHGFAIYRVSKKTTRDDIGQQLCVGDDPSTIPAEAPALHNCNNGLGLGARGNEERTVFDAKDDVVLMVPANTQTYPTTNRVWSEPGRLMSANAPAFLQGGTAAAPIGETLTYRFLKTGRYLVLCMNRSHFFNDWMFGFVDVEGDDDDHN